MRPRLTEIRIQGFFGFRIGQRENAPNAMFSIQENHITFSLKIQINYAIHPAVTILHLLVEPPDTLHRKTIEHRPYPDIQDIFKTSQAEKGPLA